MCSNSRMYVGRSSADKPLSRTQPSASSSLPSATSTRAFNAGTGRTFGKKSPTYNAVGLVEQVERADEVSLCLSYAGFGHAGAVHVLRHSVVLAELLASQQMQRGGIQVIALSKQVTDPDVHVGRSP